MTTSLVFRFWEIVLNRLPKDFVTEANARMKILLRYFPFIEITKQRNGKNQFLIGTQKVISEYHLLNNIFIHEYIDYLRITYTKYYSGMKA